MLNIKKKIFIIIVILMIGLMSFGFAEPSEWAKEDFLLMNYEGILNDEIIKVDKLQNNISREELSELMVRLYSKATKKSVRMFSEISPFNDTDNIMVAKAYNIGIINGLNEGKFFPKENVKVEFILEVLKNMTDILKEDSNIIDEELLLNINENLSSLNIASREDAIVIVSKLAKKLNWIKEINLSKDKREIDEFIVPNEISSQILVYNPSDENIDLRLVSKVVIDGKLNIRKQQIEVLNVLDSNKNIDYKNIMKIADIIHKAYDDVTKRYELKEKVVVKGYYRYEIYGMDNLTIDCIKR